MALRTRMKSLLPFLLLVPAALMAQNPRPQPNGGSPAAPPAQVFWRCDLPGGTYEVAVRSIVSVSSHEFVVDGAARVTEVNIDTAGPLVARFYYLEPYSPASPQSPAAALTSAALQKLQGAASSAADTTGLEPAWKKVVKNYPATTHAHTIEYRLSSKDDLTALFTSVETSFHNGTAGAFKVSQ